MLSEHRRLLRDTLADDRRRGAVHRGRLVLRRVRRRRGRARPPALTAQRALAAHDWPNAGGPPRVRMGLHTGYARAAAAASTPAPRCTGRPGSPPPRTAGRCSARRRPPGCAEPLPDGRLPARPRACTGCAASTTGSGCSSSSRPGWSGSSPARVPPSAAAHNLPTQVTSFVGREAERAELRPADRPAPAGDGGRRGRRRQDPARGRGGRRPGGGVPGRRVVRRPRHGHRPGSGGVRDRRGARAAARARPPDRSTPSSSTPRRRRMLLVLDTCDAQPAAIAPRWSPGCSPVAAGCGCWPPAGSRWASPARWCGASRRWRSTRRRRRP